jgi:DNA-binding NarL/FixJ family response regulator
VRVVVADDSMLLREGLVRLLTEADCRVVAAVADAPSFLEAVTAHHPDVAVVDVRMPPKISDDGLRAAVEARAAQPTLGVLMLSAYIELSYADVLLSDGRGGVGYLLKDRVASLDTLVEALRTIVGGGTVLDPEVVAQLLVARRRDPLSKSDAAGAGRTGLDGRGPEQLSHRRAAGGQPRRGGEARVEHLRQDQPARPRRGQPAGAGRARVAEGPLTSN